MKKLLDRLIMASARGETNKIYKIYNKIIALYNKIRGYSGKRKVS